MLHRDAVRRDEAVSVLLWDGSGWLAGWEAGDASEFCASSRGCGNGLRPSSHDGSLMCSLRSVFLELQYDSPRFRKPRFCGSPVELADREHEDSAEDSVACPIAG